ncbi:MAG: BREX-1 system phosphatase PglZ type B, partial [Caldilineales bacterium]|nr:BREX-1 system phosphatase PglZ type B [Caldilineales bacterium]
TLVIALQRAGDFNKNDQAPPAAILWPDKERQWEPLLPALRLRLPLLTLDSYDPAAHSGPASYLRCIIAGALDETLPAGGVPVIYLPGVSRQDVRAVEECPKPLQPLAELQYRGVIFSHKNGRDWTIAGFLQAADGLGIAVGSDAATREAMQRALLKLAHEPIARLKKEAPLKAAFFDELLNPDQVRRLLLWLNDPTGYPDSLTPAEWYAFCALCKQKYGFHPLDDGALAGAERLGRRQGAWQNVWDRFEENPEGYPNLPELLARAQPQLSLFGESTPVWPNYNRTAEEALRSALLALGAAAPADARNTIAHLEADHGPRRTWVWAKLGQAPLASALQHLAALAGATEKPLGGATVADIAAAYTEKGWQADAAALDALAAVEAAEDVAAVKAAVAALYRPWLEKAAAVLQTAVLGNPAASYAPGPPPAAEAGTCILFSDALRFDVGKKLAAALERRGLACKIGWRLAALPTVTPTAKPAVAPVAGQMAGSGEPGLTPIVKATGASSTAAALRKLLEGAGYQILTGDALGDSIGMAWTELGAIDQYGHEHGWKLSHHLPAELRGLERRIDALLAHGWQQVVVVTDHGWLLLPLGLSLGTKPLGLSLGTKPDGLPKVELPQHLTVVRKGRCAVLKEGAQTDQHTIPWHWDGDVRIAVASGIACYEAGVEYEHGGISPQECVTPVITVSKPVAATTVEAAITAMTWKGLRCAITVSGAGAGMTVDLRTKTGNAATSLAAPKAVEAGAASLLVEDDDQLGAAAFVVLLNAEGALVAQAQTTVGG